MLLPSEIVNELYRSPREREEMRKHMIPIWQVFEATKRSDEALVCSAGAAARTFGRRSTGPSSRAVPATYRERSQH
jgi:hypothetical protein